MDVAQAGTLKFQGKNTSDGKSVLGQISKIYQNCKNPVGDVDALNILLYIECKLHVQVIQLNLIMLVYIFFSAMYNYYIIISQPSVSLITHTRLWLFWMVQNASSNNCLEFPKEAICTVKLNNRNSQNLSVISFFMLKALALASRVPDFRRNRKIQFWILGKKRQSESGIKRSEFAIFAREWIESYHF